MSTPMNDRDGWIWLDGRMVPWREAKIHVLTHGLHYASSVFEGERAYDGEVFELARHTERLINSATLLDMKLTVNADVLSDATMSVLEANKLKDAYIRPFVWRGSETISAAAPDNSIHAAIAAWHVPSHVRRESQISGVRLQTAGWRRPPPECAPPQAKAASNYAIATLSKHAAIRAGYDDALLLDWMGNVAEAAAANIFFVRGDELHTPAATCFLNGITRQTIIGLADSAGFRVVERTIPNTEIAEFPECFLTGTLSEITPVAGIDAIAFRPQTATRRFIEAYAELVRTHDGTAII